MLLCRVGRHQTTRPILEGPYHGLVTGMTKTVTPEEFERTVPCGVRSGHTIGFHFFLELTLKEPQKALFALC